jgi:hypothetical protein
MEKKKTEDEGDDSSWKFVEYDANASETIYIAARMLF